MRRRCSCDSRQTRKVSAPAACCNRERLTLSENQAALDGAALFLSRKERT